VSLRFVFPALALCVTVPLALAQSSTPQPAERQPLPSTDSQQPGFTLHTDVRIVLTDVTVTDKKGNVVHGLPQSAFHVTLDKQPRPLLSFEEHIDDATAIAKTPNADTTTFSNEYLAHLPPVLNIVVLDVWNIGLVQQMSLAYDFNRFLKQLPPDKPIAIYARSGDNAVLLQNFTSDHKLLLDASARAMPNFLPMGRESVEHGGGSDQSLLFQVATDLSQIPGHKNVLWFSGGSPLITAADPSSGENAANLQIIYDMLETARATLYPIDVRGIAGNFGVVARQHMQMEDSAESTGGRAFFNGNFVDRAGEEILAADNSFYTLTVSPADFHPDNKWHKIHITLDDSKYHLNYRQGFFADSNNLDTKKEKPRTMLLAGGKRQDLPADIRSSPIIFSASVAPSSAPSPDPENDYYSLDAVAPPAQKGDVLYTLRYHLPSDTFLTSTLPDGRTQSVVNITALAFNTAGEQVAKKGNHITIKFPAHDPQKPIYISQQMPLRKGDNYLYIAVWDTITGRLGTLQIPITVK